MSVLKRSNTGLYIVLAPVAVFMMLPLVYLVSTAFKPYEELFLFPPRFFVRRPTLDNFGELIMAAGASIVPFSRYIFNSVVVTVVSVMLIMLISTMAAYPLAKHEFPGKTLFFVMTTAAFMFAVQVTQIPRFLVVNALGMVDTYWALIIPVLAYPFGVFIFRQFMIQIPGAMIEAAEIDGANQWAVFSRIILPLVRPAIFTVVIFAFVQMWNDAFSPLVYIRTEALKTLPYALNTISGGNLTVARQGALAAASLLTTLPTIVIFVLVQRGVLETMAHSGIKS